MSRHVKGLLQEEFERKIAGENIGDFLVVDTTGLDGVSDNLMRGGLKEKNIRLLVVRNLLFTKALSSRDMNGAVGLFKGPCAVVYGGESLVDVAKELLDWARKTGSLEVKGAYLEGSALGAAEAAGLAKMPSRAQMLGRIAACLRSPGGRIAAILGCPASIIAGCVRSIEEKYRQQQGDTADS
jgi:large subunit ribosomal protein L10